MTNNSNKNNRKSIRLKHYDYYKNGAYFITICTQNREHLFGEIIDNEMLLNNAGKMIQKWLHKLDNNFEGISIDGMVIMPNHVHFVLSIFMPTKGRDMALPLHGLSEVLQWFKTMTTNEYIRGVKSNIYPAFYKRVWQRNYYEHIIRNEKSLSEIQEYMKNNPQQWADDVLYTK
ncbi:transposase [bacterium]|nr:transposase [bacterium]MBU1956930.1 transposase [bacterium]